MISPIQFYLGRWSPQITEIEPISFEPFSRKYPFCFLVLFEGLLFLKLVCLIHRLRPVVHELLNIEREYNLSSRSGASEGHIHTYVRKYTRNTYIQ
jgi:hypothetical protein